MFGFPTLRGGSTGGGGPSNDPYYSNVILLGLMEGANGSTSILETISGTNFTRSLAIDLTTAQFPFGSSSCQFDGSGEFLEKNITPWNVYSTPYSIDVWFRPTNIAYDNQGLLSNDNNAVGGENFVLYMTSAGGINHAVKGGSGITTISTSSALITQNAWNHVEASGDGAGNHYVYINGVYRATGTSTSYTTNTNQRITLGTWDPSSTPFNDYLIGQMKCARITVGVARHTGTSSFTPPASLSEYAP